MNYWVVKGRPSENDFDRWLRPERRDRWHTATPPRGWHVGDRLFFWKAAPSLEVVGLGELVGIGRRQPRGTDTWFSVKYLGPILRHPVGIRSLRIDTVLRGASFLKAGPSGTLFALTPKQGHRLYNLMCRNNSFVRDVWNELGEPVPQLTDVDLIEATEGTPRLTEHLRRERDRRLVEAKKRQARSAGSLQCEACGFDFERKYGVLGRDYCEVHHRRFLARTGPVRTTLDDLAVLCSNCHRMLHRAGRELTIAKLRRTILAEA
jgi:5-methylcytosine-specific restriction endonuclease McrA